MLVLQDVGTLFEAVDAIVLAKVFACAFFAVILTQSSLDKVFDRKGNLDWLTPHFEKSPLRGMVPLMLTMVTLTELLGGFGCAASVISLLLSGPAWLPLASMSVVCLNFIMLMAGQRWSKDYAGAAALAGYFACALVGMWLIAQP
jgi:hypothetical protein